MNFIEWIKDIKGGPTDREKFAVAAIEALGLKFDDLLGTRDEKALHTAVEAYKDKALKELTDKAASLEVSHAQALASVSDGLKAAGFDFGHEKIADLKGAVDARVDAKVKEAASREALKITASRGIQPVATGQLESSTKEIKPDVKGRERVIASLEAMFESKKN